MSKNGFFSRKICTLFKRIYSVKENPDRVLGDLKNILVVRQHNQFGDLLASVSLFRAIKETYPSSRLTVIVSPENHFAVDQNEFIDESFLFDKRKLFNPFYLYGFGRLLKKNYDAVIVPATVAVSFTSCFIGRLSNSNIRIGPASLNGRLNQYSFFFDRRIQLDWQKHPDSHVSDFTLDIVRPFGIKTKNYSSSIGVSSQNRKTANDFIHSLHKKGSELLIGLHVGAGKPKNRWSLDKFISLINRLNEDYSAKFYITGSKHDKNEIGFIRNELKIDCGYFLDKTIPDLAAVISKSDLFITNDTGVMHVAGATPIPQISVFGPTNPFNWAPIGVNKYFIRKSDLIDDVSVDDVMKLCRLILG